MKGKGNLSITGQIQDVMRESMQAGLSWVRSNAAILGIQEDFFEKHEFTFTFQRARSPKMAPRRV